MITVTKHAPEIYVVADEHLTVPELEELGERINTALALHHQGLNNDATGLFHVPAEVHADPRLSMRNRAVIIAALLAAFLAVALAQNTLKPKSTPATKKTETVFDFSTCDTVRVSMPLHRLEIRQGSVEAYWFKKYKDVTPMTITCETETR